MNGWRLILVAACFSLSVVSSTWAIVSRDDVSVNNYIVLAADPAFSGARFTVSNGGGGTNGTAVLISPDTVLFSAHLLYNPTDSSLRPGTGTASFLAFFTSDVYVPNLYSGWFQTPDGPYTPAFGTEYWQLDPASIEVNPLYVNANGGSANSEYDMAVGKIIPGRTVGNSVAASTLLPNAQPMRILDSDIAPGTQITIVGNGRSGAVGYAPNSTDDAAYSGNTAGVTWRGAQNIADNIYGSSLYQYDFDSPYSPALNISGSPVPLALEGTTAVGDSGSAWMVMTLYGWAVAGTTVGGSLAASADYRYGEIGYGTNLYNSKDWLISMGASPIPEPTPTALVLLALLPIGSRALLNRSRRVAVGHRE